MSLRLTQLHQKVCWRRQAIMGHTSDWLNNSRQFRLNRNSFRDIVTQSHMNWRIVKNFPARQNDSTSHDPVLKISFPKWPNLHISEFSKPLSTNHLPGYGLKSLVLMAENNTANESVPCTCLCRWIFEGLREMSAVLSCDSHVLFTNRLSREKNVFKVLRQSPSHRGWNEKARYEADCGLSLIVF